MLHPEEAWPRRWVQRKWALAALAVAIVLAVGAIVAAVVLAAGGDEEAAEPQPKAAATVLPPESFQADAGALKVTLSWTPPTGGLEVDHYAVYRNGSPLATLSDVGTTYIDDSVRPGEEYVYEVEARSKAKTSERVSATVTTPVPPLAQARVDGDFSVVAKTLNQSGYEKYGGSSFGWHLRAKCGAGACDVVWRDLHEKGMKAVLTRKGARYVGSYSGFFFVLCGSARSTSSVQIKLKVVKAKAIEGQWRATKLVGTLSQSEVSQLGCVSSHGTQAIKAKLVR